MSDNGTAKLQVGQQQVHIHELVVRWIPANGAVQVACSAADPLVQLGMLEMAKVALIEQRAAVARGEGPKLVVPAGRIPS